MPRPGADRVVSGSASTPQPMIFDVSMAPKQKWEPYHPGIEIRRGSATLPVESRFEPAEARLV